MATPLKIKDASGNIQQLTTAEENYIAYQVGVHLAAAGTGEVGSINKTSGTAIGSYSNTFFNEPVGTHPSTSITSGTTTTNLYHTSGVASETDSDFHTPIMWTDGGGETGFKQMPSSDLNSAIDRYLSTIFTNEYPGSYRLASSSPGATWAVHLNNAFTDTRADGTSVQYNVYKKTSMTAPAAARPVYVLNSGGFDGVKAMSDRQIKQSFGQRAKTRILDSGIGKYQLRSSAQGVPADPGTWVAKGVATDTKQTTSQQIFTRDSTVNFAANYTRSFNAAYATTFTTISTLIYQHQSTGNFTTNYSKAFTRNALESFDTNYTTSYQSNYTTQYLKAYTGDYNQVYLGSYTRLFSTDYASLREAVYTPNYITDYSTTYDSLYTANYNTNYTRLFSTNYTLPYTGSFATNYTGDYARLYTGPYTRDTAVFAGVYDSANYTTAFAGPNYQVSYTMIYTRLAAYDLSFDYAGPINYTRVPLYTGALNYQAGPYTTSVNYNRAYPDLIFNNFPGYENQVGIAYVLEAVIVGVTYYPTSQGTAADILLAGGGRDLFFVDRLQGGDGTGFMGPNTLNPATTMMQLIYPNTAFYYNGADIDGKFMNYLNFINTQIPARVFYNVQHFSTIVDMTQYIGPTPTSAPTLGFGGFNLGGGQLTGYQRGGPGIFVPFQLAPASTLATNPMQRETPIYSGGMWEGRPAFAVFQNTGSYTRLTIKINSAYAKGPSIELLDDHIKTPIPRIMYNNDILNRTYVNLDMEDAVQVQTGTTPGTQLNILWGKMANLMANGSPWSEGNVEWENLPGLRVRIAPRFFGGRAKGSSGFANLGYQGTGYYTALLSVNSYIGSYTRAVAPDAFAGNLTFIGGDYAGAVIYQAPDIQYQIFANYLWQQNYDRDLIYGRDYVNFYGSYDTTYVGGPYSTSYTQTQVFQGPADTINYVGPTYAGNYSTAFIGTYVGEYQREFVGTYSGAQYLTAYSPPLYATQYVGPIYVGTYLGNYINQYTNVFETSFAIDYVGPTFSAAYTNTFVSLYDTTYAGTYTGTYVSVYDGTYNTLYVGDFTSLYTTNYVGEYTNQYTATYDIQYLTDYLGNFIGNFEGETIDATNETDETYTLYVRIS